MAKDRISQKTVAQLEAGQTLWDNLVRGFGVRRQRNAPVYVLKYRFRGRQRFVTIGPHGSPWTPEDARQEARRMLGLLASKEKPRDPAMERDAASQEITFAEMAERYLADFAAARKKTRTIAEDTRNLKLHILPVLGHLKLSDISRKDLVRFLSSHRERPIAANRCLALISHIFNVAEKWEIKELGTNPCRGIDRFKEKSRDLLLESTELANLGEVLNTIIHKNRGVRRISRQHGKLELEDWRAVACIWLLIFTGARLNEILSLEWSYINWDLGFARLPESKTGAKNLPLPNPALAILRKIRENRGQKELDSKYVFPGDRPNSYFKGIQKPWRRIRTAAGLNNVRLHDLRHCYASTAVSGGESLYLVGSILGHRQAATTQRYAHLAMTPILEVANRTAGRLAALLKPAPLSRSFPGQGDS
jgi:integrase